MMPHYFAVVELSRWQFAFTALFHFLFVPLTLGLTWILVAMETCYVWTNDTLYKDMTKFWGKLLAINFAIGVISGITMEFEFGLNWAYFSRMIGGSFGPILAIEGITAFMLEATMFGLFFFGWDKLSKRAHWVVTFFMAFGASLSIVNILAANSWMQHPTHTQLNYQNMSLELSSIAGLYLNHLAQIRIGHVAFAGFVVASIFVMGISAYYLLQNRDAVFATRSFIIGAGFGLVCAAFLAFFGDQNGLEVAQNEPEKMAAIEAQWQTQPPPVAWYVLAWPNQATETNGFTLAIPYGLSLIATHTLDGTVEGIAPIVEKYKARIRDGIHAYTALEKLWQNPKDASALLTYRQHENNLGFAYLLTPFTEDIAHASDENITAAAKSGIPNVFISFWAFRIMIGIWMILFILFIAGIIFAKRGTLTRHPFFLRCCVWSIPLPYLAAEAGWVLAETGRQPWAVHDILPTFMGISSLQLSDLVTSLVLFVLFYGALISIELFLMFKFARKGPSSITEAQHV
ncbi:MAG: cytochrome d terminal oxidase subunit 1 [Gammaproteobacteria bacterium RIFCSPHIGHO2_12_FULL_42_13]|nr:MAG: cytochrome d terminal oxidase subunit 1 [Gammaproteobacteria bacterium RIFCSPHIGHO2_12_FULL_42_13]